MLNQALLTLTKKTFDLLLVLEQYLSLPFVQ